MFLLAKYNTQTAFRFSMVKRGVVDLAVAADWTPATGDTKVSKDGGNVANATNNPSAVGGTGSAIWTLTLTAAELSAAEVVVQIVDSATKAVEDQVLRIYTYGNASAAIPVDLSDTVRLGLSALPNAAAAASGGLFTRGTGAGQINQDANGRIDVNLTHAAGTAWGSGAIAAASFAADAITAAKVASDVGTEIGTAVWATTTRLLTAGTNIALAKGTGITGFTDLDATGVRSAVGLTSASLDSQLADIEDKVDDLEGRLTASRAANLDNLDAAISSRAATGAAMGLTAGAVDAVLDEVVEGSVTFRQMLRLFAASLGGKLSGAATSTITIRDLGDAKNRVTATVDANGNRSAVTLDLT